MELLQKIAPLALVTFVISSMLAMGLGLTVGGIVAPLRDVRRVILSLVANFVLVPLAAVGIAYVLHLDEPLGIGLMLLGLAAGAPFLPKLTQLAKGNLAFAVGLMVLLMVVTIVYLPLVLPLILSGVTVDSGKIARSLIAVMMLPLAVGLAAKVWFAKAAAAIRPVLERIANLSLIVFVLVLVIVNFKNVLAIFGTRGILAGLLLIAISFGIGWVLGGPDPDGRRVVALGTSQRNIAAAIVVGSQSFTDPKVVVMVVVVAIVGLVVLMPLAPKLARAA